MAEPAWTRTRSPGLGRSMRLVSMCSRPSAVRTRASPRSSTLTTSAVRPSSEQVMHTSSSQVSGRNSPVCSKHTWVSSHNRWYMRTKSSDAAKGSSVSSHSTWSAAPSTGRGPAPIHTVSTPQAGPRRMASLTSASPAPATATTMSPGRTVARRVATRSAPAGTTTAGRARLPMITGWTNSTATWWAWNTDEGEMHQSVPPAAKRRARASEARARSSQRPTSADAPRSPPTGARSGRVMVTAVCSPGTGRSPRRRCCPGP